MTGPQQPSEPIRIRSFIAPRRSGSALLMRIFAESPLCSITENLSPPGNVTTQAAFLNRQITVGDPHHPIIAETLKVGKKFLITKEDAEIGFPLSTYRHIRPIFLIRDPIRTFESWTKFQLGSVASLETVYRLMYNVGTHRRAPDVGVMVVAYERLVQEPESEIRRICNHWGIPFVESMLNFKKPFGYSMVVSSQKEKQAFDEATAQGLHNTVETYDSPMAEASGYPGILSNTVKDQVEKSMGQMYLDFWKADVEKIRTVLAEKTWIGFDLDDTLHEFSMSTGIAATKIIAMLSGKYGLAVPVLAEAYYRILAEKTQFPFLDDRSSTQVRKERFTAVLTHFSIPPDENVMQDLLEAYEATYITSLELKSGARSLLSTIKKMGKKIVIITEGPYDVQDRVVEALGISRYVDFLATASQFGSTKYSGLYPAVLKHLSISPTEMAYVGDKTDRDFYPAMAKGIYAIQFDEKRNVCLDAVFPRLNTLNKIEYILVDKR
ncbi:hypothetical protein OQA88_8192 [Cercophora sp. LCS_1]